MPTTPSHDEHGKSLLSDSEYHRVHMLEQAEYDQLPQETRDAYARTHAWHFQRRQGDVDVQSIQTGDGMSYRDKLEQYRSRDRGGDVQDADWEL